MTGIYKIENLVNGKVYIGQALNINKRWRDHRFGLRHNNHQNSHLQNSWNKYGEENFKFEIIEECADNKLTEREQYWIDYYGGLNSINNYNNMNAGTKGKLSNESKQKISNSKTGVKLGALSEEHKRKISQANKGKKRTPEQIKNITLGRDKAGRTQSNATRQKISNTLKNMIWVNKLGKNKHINRNELEIYLNEGYEIGQKMSDTTKEKIKQTLLSKNKKGDIL